MIIAHHENENKFHRAWPQSKHCEIQYLQTQPRPDSGQTLLHDPLVSLSQAVYHFIFCLKKEENDNHKDIQLSSLFVSRLHTFGVFTRKHTKIRGKNIQKLLIVYSPLLS